MPTNVFSGRTAFLGVSSGSTETSVAFGALQGFTVTVDKTTIPVISADTSGWTEYFPGHASWTLTADTLVFSTAATSEQDTLRIGLSSERRQYFEVQNNTSTAAGTASWTFEGFGYVTGWSMSGDQASAQVHNFTITGDGALSES